MRILFFVISVTALMGLYSCDDDGKRMTDYEDYTGPLKVVYGAEILHSDSGVVKARIKSPKILEFENGDQDMPQGVYLEFFNKNGQVTGSLKADHAMYTKETELWKAWENVVVNNISNGERLNTEELFWDPKNEKVFTEKFVQITTENQVLLGQGMVADQDFSAWQITKPTGEITIEQ